MTDLERAKSIFSRGGVGCVLVCGDTVVTRTERGIAPLLALCEEPLGARNGDTTAKSAYDGFSAADRIVGKAAALLYAHLGVAAVWAQVMSKSAVAVLRAHGIAASAATETDAIRNRAGTGPCPMECAVAAIDDPETAVTALRAALTART